RQEPGVTHHRSDTFTHLQTPNDARLTIKHTPGQVRPDVGRGAPRQENETPKKCRSEWRLAAVGCCRSAAATSEISAQGVFGCGQTVQSNANSVDLSAEEDLEEGGHMMTCSRVVWGNLVGLALAALVAAPAGAQTGASSIAGLVKD